MSWWFAIAAIARHRRRLGPPRAHERCRRSLKKPDIQTWPNDDDQTLFLYKPYLFTRFSFARLCCSPTNGMSAMKKNRRPPHWDLFRSVSDQFFSCQNSSGNWLPSSRNTQPAAAAAAAAAAVVVVQLQGKNGVVLLSGKVWKEQIDGCHYSLTFASRAP